MLNDMENNECYEKHVDVIEEQAYVAYKEVQNALNVLTTKENIFLLDAEQLLDLFDVVNHAIKYSGE
jgi:uncharacterized protein YfbU (UPF0304 family)